LASSRDTSNGPGWQDVADWLESFESQTGMTVVITVQRKQTGQSTDLALEAQAYIQGDVDVELVRSGYVKSSCLGTNRSRLEAALLVLLYQLDGKLALNEFDGVVKKP